MILLKALERTSRAGIPVVIENPVGSTRHWKDPFTDTEGDTTFEHAYGYIPGAPGMDNEDLDVFLGPEKDPREAFIVTQRKGPEFTSPDEHKAFVGFTDIHAAKRAYLQHYDDDRFLGDIHAMPIEQFRAKVVLMQRTKRRADLVL
jgi:hypothetical protein